MIVDLTNGMGGSLVRRYLSEQPEVAAAIERTGARVVVFEAARGDFFVEMQRALDQAIASEPRREGWRR